MNGTIVVGGALARKPGFAGHTWVFLQYLLGFRELGWDVLFLDRLDAEEGSERGVEYTGRVMEQFGLGDDWSVRVGDRDFGLAREEVLARAADAAMLLNVMGYIADEEVLAAVPMRVFLDIDPGFGQMWRELGLADIFEGHDAFVTIAENIGQDGCGVPTCGIDWITTRQPIVLDEWDAAPDPSRDAAFTSVGSWRGPFAPIEFGGATYGLRVHEFRKFTDVPRETGARFEVALDIDEADGADVERLRAGGWTLVDPSTVAADPDAYREFVRRSKAEFMVAKNMYVDTASGWFSDRSICYLASGRPVLAQDTGLRDRYPVGEGLVVFSTADEAAQGVAEISGGYERHALAARELAEEYFDSRKVLARLLTRLGVEERSGRW